MDRNLENRLYSAFKASSGVSTDSRHIEPGVMFFALKGEKFDGNVFALQALENGASCAVVSAASHLPEDERLIVVEDTLAALQTLARMHRSKFRIPVIGLTGTNGKTTTKELLCAVLSSGYRVTATSGNLNNHIGVPLTLLRITDETEIAVIEMGASHPGEIATLASIALPDYGLVTNVGKAHLEGFGSFDGVKRTKGELYDYLQRTGDTVFLNADDSNLCAMAAERPDLKVVRYGVDYSGAEILPVTAEQPWLRMEVRGKDGERLIVSTKLIGSYNAANVMAALCVGQYFNIPLEAAVAAVENYVPVNLRSQLERTEHNLLVLDTYNANPSSMKASLDNFAASLFPEKVVILGDMLELGNDSTAEHESVISRVAGTDCKKAFFVGKEFCKAAACGKTCDERFIFCEDIAGLHKLLEAAPLCGFTILLKGSNAMRLPSLKDVL